MPKPWWYRNEVQKEAVRPDIFPDMQGPPMGKSELLAKLYFYHRQGIPKAALARESGVSVEVIAQFMNWYCEPEKSSIAKLSWLLRALDAKRVKFVRSRRAKGRGYLPWVLVKGETADRALLAQPTIGICACGRYQSCPCGLVSDISRRVAVQPGNQSNAKPDVAVQQNQVRTRVGHRKA